MKKLLLITLMVTALLLVGCTTTPIVSDSSPEPVTTEPEPIVEPIETTKPSQGEERIEIVNGTEITFVDDKGIPDLPEGFGIYGSSVELEGVYPGWSGTIPLTLVNGQDRERLFVIYVVSHPVIEVLEALPSDFTTVDGYVESFEVSVIGFEWGLTREYGESWEEENLDYGVEPLDPDTGEKLAPVYCSFNYSLSGLPGSTTYHWRAKILTRLGWFYGPDRVFTTPLFEALPEKYLYWLTVKEPEVTVGIGEVRQVNITLEIPSDADYAGKHAEVRIRVDDTTQTGLVQIALECRWFIITAD